MYTRIIKLWRSLLTLLTGYDLEAEEEKSSSSDPSIALGPLDFAIVFRGTKIEAIVPSEQADLTELSEEEVEAYSQIDGTISYLMHCLMRDDWQEEFFDAVEVYLENASEIEAQERRSQFKLIVREDNDDGS